MKIKHVDYMKLLERVGALEKENAKLKADLKKASVKSEKTEIKKGGKN
jgi:uncharacterized small protein (DUF1192 family)